MNADLDTRSTEATAPWAIGDPGRAAGEVPPGRPPRPTGHGDVVVSWSAVGAIRTTGATVRGLMHRALDGPRQDAFALSVRETVDRDDALVAVVCDGVGSLARSHEAANLVSRRLAEAGAAGDPWPDAISRVNEELGAVGLDGDVKMMATTAVALTVWHEDGDWVGDLAWVGDSPCWHLAEDGTWTELSTTAADDDADDAYHSTRVRPLPSSTGDCRTTSFRVSRGAVFLMSDGVANPIRWSEDVQEALAAWWRKPGDPLTFAGQVGFARKTHIDDRTVVAIWHQPTDEDAPHEDPQLAAGPAD